MGRFTVLAKLYVSELLAALRRDMVIYAVLVGYLAAGTGYVLSKSGVVFGALEIYFSACTVTYLMIMPYVVLTLGIARITHRLGRRRRLAYRLMFQPRRVARFVAGTLLMLLALPLFESMFASVKNTFAGSGFPYEKLAADLDKAIHFGHAPVRYMLSVARYEWLLQVMEINYDLLWFIVCFGILFWIATSPRADTIRLRYFATFFCVWVIIGNIAAGIVPTAGPAFYGFVTGDTVRFSGMLDFIGTSTDWFSAADAQRYLWSLQETGRSGLGSGVSAFPSMHVALVSMNAMFAAERGVKLAVIAALYTLFIMLSSVYLGWHYAIDGYGALLLTALIYWSMRVLFPCLQAMRMPAALVTITDSANTTTALPNTAE
jgi:membrane-associated phospholipid phosphatase